MMTQSTLMRLIQTRDRLSLSLLQRWAPHTSHSTPLLSPPHSPPPPPPFPAVLQTFSGNQLPFVGFTYTKGHQLLQFEGERQHNGVGCHW